MPTDVARFCVLWWMSAVRREAGRESVSPNVIVPKLFVVLLSEKIGAGRAARGGVRFGRASGAMTIFDLLYGSNTRRQSVSMKRSWHLTSNVRNSHVRIVNK